VVATSPLLAVGTFTKRMSSIFRHGGQALTKIASRISWPCTFVGGASVVVQPLWGTVQATPSETCHSASACRQTRRALSLMSPWTLEVLSTFDVDTASRLDALVSHVTPWGSVVLPASQ